MRALRAIERGTPIGLSYHSAPEPEPGTGDVLVEVHAAGYTPGELQWPSTWVDRSGHDRTPVVPCHEVSGVVAALGFGTSGVSVGDEVFGVLDWYRDGAAAELVAVEARNLAPRPRSVSHAAAATLPLAGLTAWQALIDHGRLISDETVLILGAGGGVGSLAIQIARHLGARALGAGRSRDRDAILDSGAAAFVDLDGDEPPDLDGVSLVLDAIGGAVAARHVDNLDAVARCVSIVDPAVVAALGSRGTFFVVEPDRPTLTRIAELVDQAAIRPALGRIWSLHDGEEAVRAKEEGRESGKLTLQVR